MNHLKRLREARNLTQAQLAALTGLKQQYISDLETGRIQQPSLQAGLLLAAALSVQPQDLVTQPIDPPVAQAVA